MFKIGDCVQVKEGAPYMYTTPGSTGVVIELGSSNGGMLLVRFSTFTGPPYPNNQGDFWLDPYYLELITASNNATTSHQHIPATYLGLTETFVYCQTCNQKLEDLCTQP